MRRRRHCAALIVSLTAVLPSTARTQLAASLEERQQLVYSSGGVESIWTIDRVVRDTTLGDRRGCVVILLRTTATQTSAETRAHCTFADTMTNWVASAGEHRPARMLAPGTLVIPRPTGGEVRFVVGQPAVDTVSNTPFRVLPTEVITTDQLGKVIRRLRERFAIGLATATSGVFEVPDSSSQSGWRVERSFKLLAIRQP